MRGCPQGGHGGGLQEVTRVTRSHRRAQSSSGPRVSALGGSVPEEGDGEPFPSTPGAAGTGGSGSAALQRSPSHG